MDRLQRLMGRGMGMGMGGDSAAPGSVSSPASSLLRLASLLHCGGLLVWESY